MLLRILLCVGMGLLVAWFLVACHLAFIAFRIPSQHSAALADVSMRGKLGAILKILAIIAIGSGALLINACVLLVAGGWYGLQGKPIPSRTPGKDREGPGESH
jgi:hypothetical protein